MLLRSMVKTLCLVLLIVAGLESPLFAQPVRVPFEGGKRPVKWALIRLGRFQQSNQWERLAELSESALNVGKQSKNKQLLQLGQWYTTLVKGRNGEPAAEVLESLQQATQYGYHDVVGIRSADELAVVRGDEKLAVEFNKLVDDLQAEIDTRLGKTFREAADRQVAANEKFAPKALPLERYTLPERGGNLAESKEPQVLILSRTYHDGFAKQWDSLSEVTEGGARPVALFYENNPSSEASRAMAARYAKVVGVPASGYALIGRQDFTSLRETLRSLHSQGTESGAPFDLYFPCSVVVDDQGVPLFFHSGILSANGFRYIIQQLRQRLTNDAGEGPKATPPPDEPPAEESADDEEEASTSDADKTQSDTAPAPEPKKDKSSADSES